MLLALFVIALSAYSTQASFSKGNCLEIPTIANIDFDRYIGDWYEIERFSSWFESSLKCGKAEYAKIDSSSISVRNSGVNKKTGALTSIDGHASVISADAQNKLSLQLPIVVSGITVYKNNGLYNIWETDYDNYALIYSCRQILPKILKYETSWVLSRGKTLPAEKTEYLKNLLISKGLDSKLFEVVDQEGC